MASPQWRDREHFFVPGKPTLSRGQQTVAQFSSPGGEVLVRPPAQGTDTSAAVGAAAAIISAGMKSAQWVDPVSNPVRRGFQFGVWAPETNKFGANARGENRPHQGVDILAPFGTPVFAVRDGNATRGEDATGFGKYIVLEFEVAPGKKLYAFYAHLSQINFLKPIKVKAGTIIGSTGNSGNASKIPSEEYHLHFGISTLPYPTIGTKHWLDPELFMKIPVQAKPEPAKKEESSPK
ncbi:MAG TPA: M23 family metallopeptidase [Thermoanaerobaculia bacterium]|nr:M23 family metallopeptidase [Thermoanaerobaculia bacterium]